MQPPCAGLHVERKAVTGTSVARRALVVIACSPRPVQHGCFQKLLLRCGDSTQQLWAAVAAHQQQNQSSSRGQNWKQSLCIGAGVGAVAFNGSGGHSGPPNSGGGGSGGGGSGWGHTPGSSGSPGSNVLADVAAAAADESSEAALEEVVLLDVGGMKCGGCVGHVKQLLEAYPSVSSATINLATETALVRVQLAAGADLNTLAAELAKVLSKGGFPSKARPRHGSGWVSDTSSVTLKRQQKLDKLHKTTQDLVVAWGLSLLCGLGHLGHVWTAAPAWLHALHHPVLAATMSAAALLGPGRDIITSGWQALSAGRPDMNSLVGLGATASFAVSCVAAALPALRWKTFFEEPAMLLGFVLVGRALEERAKLQASSDMTALQALMPQTARLTLQTTTASGDLTAPHFGTTTAGNTHAAGSQQSAAPVAATSSSSSSSSSSSGVQWVEVPADAVGLGDVLLVLPGDRVPVDGTVVSGRSTVDESALTGEPLPLVKQQGASVTAGTLNCDGSLLVAAEASGQDTVIADIVRMVEAAQARTAPIQRLADSVAGKFAYGVMGLSAATFAFWSTAGTKLFPQVLSAATAGAAASGGAAGAAAAGACCCPPAAGAAAGAAGAAGAAAGGAAAVPAAAAVLLGLQLACNVLVVACPCALGLATPTAVLVGTAAGARKGLLVRGGDILEATSQVDTVVFDKTGTLTAGKPVVAGITMLQQAAATKDSSSSSYSSGVPSPAISPSVMLQLAAAVERQATHPVAKALVAAAAADRAAIAAASASCSSTTGPHDSAEQQQLLERRASHAAAGSSSAEDKFHFWQHKHSRHSSRSSSSSSKGDSFLDADVAASLAAGGVLEPDTGSFLQEPGSGAVAMVAGHRVSVGTLDWVNRQGAQLGQLGEQQLQQGGGSSSSSSSSSSNVHEPLTGHTQVYVGVDDVIVGLVDVADIIRSDARSTVQELHDQGIRTIMLSGDRQEAAVKVAAAVGIAASDVHAGIKPAGKAALVEHLKAQGHKVAMVGDGINDTAALAAADVGMAMAGGVDAASDVSKVVLMGDQLHQVCDAIELSRKTLCKIQQNLGWAFCYNLVGIPLAAGVLLPKYGLALTPSISGALMGVSSLAVMANSLVLQWEVRGLRNGLVTAQAHEARAAAAGAVGQAYPQGKPSTSSSGSSSGKQQRVAVVAAGMDAV